MPILPSLLPAPRSLILTGSSCTLKDKSIILLDTKHPQSLMFSALQLQAALKASYHQELNLYAGYSSHLDNVSVTLRLEPKLEQKPQGYRLTISPEAITINARDAPGIFYGCSTLIQLIQYYSPAPKSDPAYPLGSMPCLEIDDWPDFPNRGIMLDVSRDKVPTMETLFDLVDLLASWKINQLQLYTEHTFAYQRHPDAWVDASPFTGEEILKLDAYCTERFIELVPNQNSFGHLERWLKLPRYNSLAEAPDGFDFPWGHYDSPFSLCPLEMGSITLLQGLYDELLPHFSSRQFNVGCDETFDLGQGRSKAECERLGSGRVYLDFLLKIYTEVSKRGFHMQFWGDIIMAHPELVQELPKDSIALEWGYEADHPFDEHGAKFAQAGLSFYVCPGTSSWNSIAGRTDNCLQNLANAAQNGIKYGADGYLITDWGDNGHWQTLLVSYLGFAAGAAYSWCYQSNQNVEIREVLNRYAFQDPTENMGKLAYELGNIYHEVGIEPQNASALFYTLQKPFSEWKDYLDNKIDIRAFHHTLETIDMVSKSLAKSNSRREDKKLLKREFEITIELLRHACKRGLYLSSSHEYSQKQMVDEIDAIVEEYRSIWLARNRLGGLNDSLTYFTLIKSDYR